VAYRGVTARLPIGAQGFTGTRNQSQAGPGHLLFTEGAELDAGIIRKDGGAVLVTQFGSFTTYRSVLHFNGADLSTGIVDDGFSPGIWTAVDNAKLTTADFKFGPSSLTLDGAGDYVTAPSLGLGSQFALQPFTVHAWFKNKATTGTRRNLMGQTDAAENAISTSITIDRTTANVIRVRIGSSTSFFTLTGTTQFTDVLNNGWNHIAVVRDMVANLLRLFINGVQEASTAIPAATAVNASANQFSVGAIGLINTNTWFGLVDEVVINRGRALWTANFTPPTKPSTAYGPGADIVGGDTPLPVIAGTSWAAGVNLNEDVVVLDNGAVFADPNREGSFINQVGFSLITGRDPPPYFCVGGGEVVGQPRKMFLFTANNQVQVRLGASSANQFAPISTPPADWTGAGNFPTFGCVHVQRMFGGGNASDPHRLYYSMTTDHQTYTGGSGAGAAGTIPIYPGQGERLVGAYSIRGALILWKYPLGIYVLITQDPDPTTWSVEVLSRSVGGVNPHSMMQVENDLLYIDRSGAIHSLTATNDFGDFNTSNVSEIGNMQPFFKDNVNRGKLQRAQAIWYSNKRQAWFFYPRTNSNIPDLRVQLAFPNLQQQQQTGPSPRFFMSRRDTANALWLRPDNADGLLKPAIGSENGCVYTLDADARNKNGAAYPIQFSTASTDLSFVDPSLATKQKNGQFLEIVYEPEGEWDLLVDTFWDDIYTETLAYTMGGAGGILGSFVLGTDVLGAAGIREIRRRVAGSGRRFKVTCTNSGLDQNVSLAEFHLSFTIGDERTPEA
jgi:Concanavalin A-like lectin/glucanases superfamily